MAGWMEFRVCWWKGWLGRVVNMAAPDVPGPVKPGAYDSAANGGRRGASLKGGLGWGPDWISNWMEPKSFVVGKTRSGRPDWGFTILHPKDLHSNREEWLGPKIHHLPAWLSTIQF